LSFCSSGCSYYTPVRPSSSSFFFYRSGHPRALHSFPTRRSSDLGWVYLPCRIPEEMWRAFRLECFRKELRHTELIRQLLESHLRSEEHTSELQSRENLVCRLLLEKKKKKKKIKNTDILTSTLLHK